MGTSSHVGIQGLERHDGRSGAQTDGFKASFSMEMGSSKHLPPVKNLTWPMAKRLKLFGIKLKLVGKISPSNSFFQGPLAE